MKKIGHIFLYVPVRIVYFFWGLWNRILYPPRIRFADRETKRLFRKTPAILIANHTAHTDGYYLPQTLGKRRLYTYVTRKWYDKRSIHWLFTRLPYIPVDLTGLDTEWLAMCTCLALLCRTSKTNLSLYSNKRWSLSICLSSLNCLADFL